MNPYSKLSEDKIMQYITRRGKTRGAFLAFFTKTVSEAFVGSGNL